MPQMPNSISVFDLKSLLPEFHEIKLPSNGLFDPEVPALLNVRAMTIKELKQITANGKLDKQGFDNTIKDCIKEPINISRLLIEDYNYIIYMIRLFSSGGKVSTIKICDNSKCQQQFKFDYNIEKCALVEYAENAIDKTKTIHLPRFESLGYDVNIEVKRLTRGDLITVEKNIRQSAEISAKTGTPNTAFPLTEFMKAYVVSITGFPVPVAKEQLLDVLSSQDAEALTNAFDTSFGVKGEAVIECPFCKTENHYDIPFTDIFFL